MDIKSLLEQPNSQQDPQTYAIIGAAMAVHSELGRGFLESVYQAAFERELRHQNIHFEREAELPVLYKGSILPVSYRADFICFGQIVVKLKALSNITSREDAQIINYLKATGLHRGLLINFGGPSLQQKRFILS